MLPVVENNTTSPPGAFTIAGFADAFKIGRSTVYTLVQSGELKTFHVGRRRLISFTAAQEFIACREAQEVIEK